MILQFNWITLFAFFILSFIDILFTNRGLKKQRVFIKPFIIPFLLIYYFLSTTSLNILVILALMFSTIGDIFLLFRKSKTFLIFGLVSFLLAHVSYIATFLLTFKLSLIPSLCYLLIIPYVIFGIVMFKSLKLEEKAIKMEVVMYISVVVLMSFLSLLRFYSVSFKSFILTFSGSILFIISDSILSVRYFGEKRIRGEFVTITYILAQFLIVLGFIY